MLISKHAELDQKASSKCLFNGCIQCLEACRKEVCKALGLGTDDVELSMGMSGDFEQAVGFLAESVIFNASLLQ